MCVKQCYVSANDSLPAVIQMEYRVRDSWQMYPPVHFFLQREKDSNRYWLTNSSARPPEEAQIIEVDSAFTDQVRQIVIEENMLSYKSYYSPPFDVYDGSSWNLTIRFDGSDQRVSSSGYEERPKGNGLDRLEQLCRDTWDAKKDQAKPAVPNK